MEALRKKMSFFKKEAKTNGRGPPSASEGRSVAELESSNDLLLDQLSKVSQDLANARMAKQEAEQSYEEMVLRNDKLEKQVESLEVQVKKISNSFAFEEAQKTNDRVKSLNKSLAEEKKKVEVLEVAIKEKSLALSELEESTTTSSREMVTLQSRIEEQLDEIRIKDEALDTLRNQNSELTLEIKDVQYKFKKEREGLTLEHDRKIEALESACEERIRDSESEIHKLKGQRNSFMQKCKTLQKELQRVVKQVRKNEAKKMKQEVENLRQELERRTKSLQDALSALDTFVSGNVGKRGIGNVDVANGNHQFFTLQNEVKLLKSKLMQADVKIQEKDLVITQLKSATHFFGEKIMALETQVARSQSETGGSQIEQISPRSPSNPSLPSHSNPKLPDISSPQRVAKSEPIEEEEAAEANATEDSKKDEAASQSGASSKKIQTPTKKSGEYCDEESDLP
mmetsp:Transcript_29490/g.51782  ORF Transcript_29490/g.51782 Transcript_29490/m.51782 type:complete len:455 (-) Transcript_29490:231-1595(-)